MKFSDLANRRWIFRAWYYFRLGFSAYLSFLLACVSTLVTVYYLAIKNIPALLDVFPHFVPFAVLVTVVGGPVAILIGWVHLKRSPIFSSEQEVSAEANPFQYKLPPGIAKEVTYPALLMELSILRKLVEAEGLLTDSEKAGMDAIEKKIVTLLEGGYVGSPRRKLNF